MMRIAILFCALVGSTLGLPTGAVAQLSSAASPEYQGQQSWFSRDKAYHFGISAVGTGSLYVAARRLRLSRWQSVAASVVVMGTAGVWREIGTTERGDLLTRAHISRRDLVWDGIGIGVGVSITDWYLERTRK